MELGPFESLRGVFSTGAVLTPPMFEWTQKAFGERVHVISSSGGTDICGACKWLFALMDKSCSYFVVVVACIETLPVYAGGKPHQIDRLFNYSMLSHRDSRQSARHGCRNL